MNCPTCGATEEFQKESGGFCPDCGADIDWKTQQEVGEDIALVNAQIANAERLLPYLDGLAHATAIAFINDARASVLRAEAMLRERPWIAR